MLASMSKYAAMSRSLQVQGSWLGLSLLLCALQLANVTSSARGADEGDLTAAAAAAVGIATTAVDAALLNVEQAVGRASQNKQVSAL